MSVEKRDIKRVAKKLRIKNGDIVLIKQGTWLAKQERIAMLSEYLRKTARVLCLVIVVDELSDIETLDQTAMMKHGWLKLRSKN